MHIIAYNQTEKERITSFLNSNNIPPTNVTFRIYKKDDVWVRDNGPIFVRDKKGILTIQDWGFNGWGNKIDDISGQMIQSDNCNAISSKIASDIGVPLVDLNLMMINEGGGIEIDGHGTMMTCKSSIFNKNRNPNMNQGLAEAIFRQNLGITNFIWLDGQEGLDVTDQHIDGFAIFGKSNTIVTTETNDLLYFDVKPSDIQKLFAAKDQDGKAYSFIKIPLSKNNVVTTSGKNLGYKGSYVNYYTGNQKVLVPNYNYPHDIIANAKILALYPTRKVLGIDVRNLYANGGIVHCVTQKQPKK